MTGMTFDFEITDKFQMKKSMKDYGTQDSGIKFKY